MAVRTDFDVFVRQIQLWTNNIPLIILGSGASVPYGLPTMWALGDYIKRHVTLTEEGDIKQFEEFKYEFDREGDLESTLLKLQLQPNVLNQIVIKTWELMNKIDQQVYANLIEEELDFPLRTLITHLLTAASRRLSIITTNYDRLAEYAASLAQAIVCTGYSQNYIGHFSPLIHNNKLSTISGYRGQVNIWKVHGSLGWFSINGQESFQLPIPAKIPENAKPLIVTPGLSKYSETHNEPYRTIFSQADMAIESANGYLCMGYGFNDVHVQPKLITQIKNDKPIIVLTKQLTEKTKQLITEHSSARYILMEEADENDTKVYSSSFGEFVIENQKYWQLGEFNKLIM